MHRNEKRGEIFVQNKKKVYIQIFCTIYFNILVFKSESREYTIYYYTEDKLYYIFLCNFESLFSSFYIYFIFIHLLYNLSVQHSQNSLYLLHVACKILC